MTRLAAGSLHILFTFCVGIAGKLNMSTVHCEYAAYDVAFYVDNHFSVHVSGCSVRSCRVCVLCVCVAAAGIVLFLRAIC